MEFRKLMVMICLVVLEGCSEREQDNFQVKVRTLCDFDKEEYRKSMNSCVRSGMDGDAVKFCTWNAQSHAEVGCKAQKSFYYSPDMKVYSCDVAHGYGDKVVKACSGEES